MAKSFKRNARKAKQPKKRIQKTNRNFKDTLFRKLFRDEERAIELYSAIIGAKVEGKATIYPDDEFWMRQNDLSFSIGSQLMVICEHQSTINPNMPLRQLLYFSQILGAHVIGEDKLYGRSLVDIYTPKFYVLYNGKETVKNQMMKLSDSFLQKGEEPMLEVKAKIININWGSDKPILKASPSLTGYAYLVAEIRRNISSGMGRDKAIGLAIKSCISKGYLKEFLTENYEEVAAMLSFEYNYETHLEVMRREGLAEGLAEGHVKGLAEGHVKGLAEGHVKGMEEGEQRERIKWQGVVAGKDAENAAMKAEIARLRAQLGKQ